MALPRDYEERDLAAELKAGMRIQVVPAGQVADGHLRCALTLVPIYTGAAQGLSLAAWPGALFSWLADEAGETPWSVALTVTLEDGGYTQRVEAKARLAQAAFGTRERRSRIGDIWRASFFEGIDPEPWIALGGTIAASARGDSAVMPTTTLDAAADPLPEGAFGKQGQMTRGAERRTTTMNAVPQGDLAIAIEFGRAEELGCSLRVAAEGPACRKEAERDRLRRETRSLEFDGDGKETVDIEGALRLQRIARYEALFRSPAARAGRRRARAAFQTECDRAAEGTACTPIDQCADHAGRTTFALGGDRETLASDAIDMNDYVNWAQHADTDDPTGKRAPGRLLSHGVGTEDDQQEEARCTFLTMQTTPSIARLFGLTLDVDIPIDQLKNLVESGEAVFVRIACEGIAGVPNEAPVATLAKLRLGDAPWFYPASADELVVTDGARATALAQLDGHAVMGAGRPGCAPRFEITSLDIRLATEAEKQRRDQRRANLRRAASELTGAGNSRPPDEELEDWITAAYDSELAQPATLQTAGLALIDRGQLMQAARRAARRATKLACAEGAGAVPVPDLLLDAEDLTVGVRLDVGVPVRGKEKEVWRTLDARRTDFGRTGDAKVCAFVDAVLPDLTEGFGGAWRLGLDSAQHVVPARLLPTGGAGNGTGGTEAVLEEASHVWTGSPMGVDTAAQRHAPDRPPAFDVFDFGRRHQLPGAPGGPDLRKAPELRYGLPYRFKMRTTWQGGIAVPPEKGLPDDSDAGALPYPPDHRLGRPYVRFLRQTRLGPPELLIPGEQVSALELPMGPDDGGTLVVRTTIPPEGESTDAAPLRDRDRPRRVRRILLPPPVSFEEAERHGAFDAAKRDVPEGILPRARRTRDGGYPTTATHYRPGLDRVPHVIRRRLDGEPNVDAPGLPWGETVRPGLGVLIPGSEGRSAVQSYPDPLARHLVFALRPVGREGYHEDAQRLVVPIAAGVAWPDLTPVVLDLVADRDLVPRPVPHDVLHLAGDVRLSVGGRATRIEARLAPGETFEMDIWALPSARDLAGKMAVVQALSIAAARYARDDLTCRADAVRTGLTDLAGRAFSDRVGRRLAELSASQVDDPGTMFAGLGGTVAPAAPVLMAVAEEIHAVLARHPLPELAAVRTVTLTHATNRPSVEGVPDLPSPHDTPFTAPVAACPYGLRILRPATARLGSPGSPPEQPSAPEPKLVGGPPLDPGSTEAVLDGILRVPLGAIGGFEILGRAAHPGDSRFDDPARGRSLLQRRDGNWQPPPGRKGEDTAEMTARRLFGFRLAPDGTVEHTRADFTWLRVENIDPALAGPDGIAELSLRKFWQEEAETDAGGNPRWRVAHRHVFPDARARDVALRLRLISRTRAEMATAAYMSNGRFVPAAELPIPLAISTTGERDGFMMPATIRPALPDARVPEPAFRWGPADAAESVVQDGPAVRVHRANRRAVLRVRLGRGWCSAGEGEQLGLVVWPPDLRGVPDADIRRDRFRAPDDRVMDLRDIQDDDLGPGGAFVTRLGADPTVHVAHPHGAPSGGGPADHAAWRHTAMGAFLPLSAFPDLSRPEGDPNRACYVPAVQMPVTEEAARAARPVAAEIMTVGLIAYRPRFDAEAEEWFVEVELADTQLPWPFLRLGLVRYQSATAPALQVSRPATSWIQVPPRRTLRVEERPGRIDARLEGVAPAERPGLGGGDPASPFTKGDMIVERPWATFRLFEEWADPAGLLHRTLVESEPVADASDDTAAKAGARANAGIAVAARYNGAHAVWTMRYESSALGPVRPGGRLVLTVEETGAERPAAYDKEPHDPLDEETDRAVHTGPRFHARVVLGDPS